MPLHTALQAGQGITDCLQKTGLLYLSSDGRVLSSCMPVCTGVLCCRHLLKIS